ncbi:unnamed protein product, partial [Effrenium voratum]
SNSAFKVRFRAMSSAALLAPDTPTATYSTLLVHKNSVIISTDKGGARVGTCTLNLVLSTIGVGALTLPFTTAQVGWLQSLLLLLVFFLVSVYNLYLLDAVCRSLKATSTQSYAAVVAAVLGKPGAYGLEAFLLLYSFGLSVSYMGVVSTEVSVFARGQAPDWLNQDDLITLVAIFLVLPLSLLPDMVLRLAGVVGTCCMLLTTLIVVREVPWRSEAPFVDACADASNATGLSLVPWISSFPALLAAVPMFSFCMNAATAFVSIRSEMACGFQPPREAVSKLIWLAQSFALLDYVVSGVAGYVSFCQAAPDNVLDGFRSSHLPSLLARGAIALQLTAACAGVYVPLARAALCHLVLGLDCGAPVGCARVTSTVLLLGFMVLMARALDGALAKPLGLTSAVCTTAIMFMFPGLCAHRVTGQRAPLAFALAGLVIGTASTVTLLC